MWQSYLVRFSQPIVTQQKWVGFKETFWFVVRIHRSSMCCWGLDWWTCSFKKKKAFLFSCCSLCVVAHLSSCLWLLPPCNRRCGRLAQCWPDEYSETSPAGLIVSGGGQGRNQVWHVRHITFLDLKHSSTGEKSKGYRCQYSLRQYSRSHRSWAWWTCPLDKMEAAVLISGTT